MKLGVSTSVYLHYDLETAIKKIADLDFKYVELWGEPPHLWFESENYIYMDKINKLLQKYNLIPSFHAPAHDVDITSVNPGIRKESIRQHKRALRIAGYLGVKVFVIHAGSFYPGDKKGCENGLDRLYNSLEELITTAEEYNIIIAIENYPVGENAIIKSPFDIKKIIDDFNSPFLKMTLDIGHANLTDIQAIEYIKELKDKIVHLHINDNLGKEDLHQIPGKGNIDFEAVKKELDNINYNNVGIFEIWDPQNTKQALLNSRSYIDSL